MVEQRRLLEEALSQLVVAIDDDAEGRINRLADEVRAAVGALMATIQQVQAEPRR